jgi:hypothetical protein
MSVNSAYKFITLVQSSEIDLPEDCIELKDLIKIAENKGFVFTEKDLQKAFIQNYNFKRISQQFLSRKNNIDKIS